MLKIYGVPFSVHTRKVILAAKLKSIPFELVPVVPVAPDSLPSNWRTLSPTGQIPVIDADGYVLADSTAILHVFERRVAEPALLPADTKDLGRAMFLDAWAGTVLFRQIVHPIFHQRIVRPNLRKEASDAAAIASALTAMSDAFDYLEQSVGERFLVGGRLSIADLAVVSNLLTLGYVGEKVDRARHPQLAAYLARHVTTPVVAEAIAMERPFVEGVPGLQTSR